MSVTIELPASVEIDTGEFGKMTFAPDEDAKLIYAAFKVFGDAVNARVADPTNKAVLIKLPSPIPTNYTTSPDGPFGAQTFQYKASTIFALQFLAQLAAGINQDWSGS